MEAEAADSQIQYDAISANWDTMLEIRDPLDIDAAIKEQKLKCENLLEQKDKLINELKDDLKRMDESYYEDLDKQVNQIPNKLKNRKTVIIKTVTKMTKSFISNSRIKI